MSKFSMFTTTSGHNIGRNAKKIVGCENCNFMMALDVWRKQNDKISDSNDNSNSNVKTRSHSSKKVTGSTCPRCNTSVVRLFDSQAEFQRHRELQLLQEKGEIEDLEYQVKFDLHAPDFETGEPKKIGSYVADFGYFENIQESPCQDMEHCKKDYIIEDVKNKSNVITEIAKWKMQHFEAEYGIDIRIVGR